MRRSVSESAWRPAWRASAAWFTVHTIFMLNYARKYYTGEKGGIDFHQDCEPKYGDFAYLAFTLGMTYRCRTPT